MHYRVIKMITILEKLQRVVWGDETAQANSHRERGDWANMELTFLIWWRGINKMINIGGGNQGVTWLTAGILLLSGGWGGKEGFVFGVSAELAWEVQATKAVTCGVQVVPSVAAGPTPGALWGSWGGFVEVQQGQRAGNAPHTHLLTHKHTRGERTLSAIPNPGTHTKVNHPQRAAHMGQALFLFTCRQSNFQVVLPSCLI